MKSKVHSTRGCPLNGPVFVWKLAAAAGASWRIFWPFRATECEPVTGVGAHRSLVFGVVWCTKIWRCCRFLLGCIFFWWCFPCFFCGYRWFDCNSNSTWMEKLNVTRKLKAHLQKMEKRKVREDTVFASGGRERGFPYSHSWISSRIFQKKVLFLSNLQVFGTSKKLFNSCFLSDSFSRNLSSGGPKGTLQHSRWGWDGGSEFAVSFCESTSGKFFFPKWWWKVRGNPLQNTPNSKPFRFMLWIGMNL